MDQPLQRRRARVEGAPGRPEQHVVGDAARLGRLQIGEVAEIIGEEIGARVVGADDELQHVAGLELGEADDTRANVVVQAVPGLGQVALALGLALEHAAVLLEDARALDLHYLPVRRVLHALGAGRIHATWGVRAHHHLAGARREPVGEYLDHRQVGQHLDVLPGERRKLRQVPRVVQVGRRVSFLGAHRAHQLAQRRVLRAQRERASERRQRAGIVPRAEAVVAELLVRLGVVRGERERLRVGGVGFLDAAVLGQELGGAEPRVQGAGLQRERLAQQLHRPVDVRAVEQERDELAARLGVVEAERERLLELGHRLVVAAQTPVRAGGRTVRAGEVGSRLRSVDSRQGGARGEADGVQRAGLGQHGIDPLRRRRAGLARQLQRLPTLAAVEAIVRHRVEQGRVVRIRRQRGLERRAPLVAVAILQSGEPQRSFRIRRSHVCDALHGPQRHPLGVVGRSPPLQDYGEILLCPGIARARGRRVAQLVDGVGGPAGGRRMLLAPFARRRERGRLRPGSAGRLRQLDERRIVRVSHAQREAQPPVVVRDLHQDEVVAIPQLARERLLVEARWMHGEIFVDQLPVQPHARRATRAQVEEDRPGLPRSEERGRVHGDVGARVDRRRQVDEPVRGVAGGQRAPDDVVLLPAVHGLGVVPFLLWRIRGQQAHAAVILEGPDDAPRPDGGNVVEQRGRPGKLPLSDRQLGAHLGGESAHVRAAAGRLRGGLEGRDHWTEIAILVPALIQPEEVRDRLRPVELGEQACLQRRRPLLQGSGGGSQRADQEKTVHAFGLPWGEQRKRTHRKATVGGLAPFLPGADPCCSASSARPPVPRLSRRPLSGSARQRAHLDPGCARLQERPGGGGRRGSGGQDVVDQAHPQAQRSSIGREGAAHAALAGGAVASHLLPGFVHAPQQRDHWKTKALRCGVREQPGLVVSALPQAPSV